MIIPVDPVQKIGFYSGKIVFYFDTNYIGYPYDNTCGSRAENSVEQSNECYCMFW